MAYGPKPKDPRERFLGLIESLPKIGCWAWGGMSDKSGYPLFKYKGTASARRAAYLMFKGPLDEGIQITTSCQNQSCVNPNHVIKRLPVRGEHGHFKPLKI